MCENTEAADEVGDYLQQLPDFAGDKLLVIHTTALVRSPKPISISPGAPRGTSTSNESRIRCIVSVLMLREGWDVRNVSVIVTLRTSHARKRKSCRSRRLAAGCAG